MLFPHFCNKYRSLSTKFLQNVISSIESFFSFTCLQMSITYFDAFGLFERNFVWNFFMDDLAYVLSHMTEFLSFCLSVLLSFPRFCLYVIAFILGICFLLKFSSFKCLLSFYGYFLLQSLWKLKQIFNLIGRMLKSSF